MGKKPAGMENDDAGSWEVVLAGEKQIPRRFAPRNDKLLGRSE